ncbi:MAG: hypothetical protein AB1443_01410 [Pseudomonadota bacterium]
MNPPYCSYCLAPLSYRERLFDSLLCVACEQKLTAYEGMLPDPNLSFAGRTYRAKQSESTGSISDHQAA